MICDADAAHYIARYRDVERFEELCRACPNYATRWGCPPFDDNPQPRLEQYDNVRLCVVKIDLEPAMAESQYDMTQAMMRTLQSVRPQYEQKLLDLEKDLHGRAALFTGMCPHCPDRPCARRSGNECHHPGLVRPSLEALGFDLGRTLADYFGIELLWASDEKAPAYMCLIGAVFHPRQDLALLKPESVE